ncbi:5'-cyclic nucleotide phosphodiesterase 1C (Cam-PDE 1C) (3' [Durusdinium trenchii]|uniref:Phosphodiesterase n=1 Tax=Durusdinium trenchii TaxID=1381693 RepID=A0ABP0R1X5_9DINO
MRRPIQRFHTEPAPMNKLVKPHLQVMRSVSVGQPPTIPDTEGVNEMLALAGPTATLMDVAKGILDRLVERPELEVQVEEMLFLKDCLGASLETLAMPCMLLQRNTGDVTPGGYDYLMIYAKQVNTSSSCPGTPGSRSRTPSVAFSRPPPSWESLDARMLDEFDQWDFDSFELAEATKGNPLHFAGWKALDGFLGEQSSDVFLEMERTSRFLEAVEDMYSRQDKVLYHNNVHAADVTQCVHALLKQFGFAAYFDQLSILAILLGAIVHDMGHDGRTNSFHVNVCDDIALTYNDISVLENMHISKTFKLMHSDLSTNILEGFKIEHRNRLRKEMVEVVLGTDMSSHFGNVADFKTLVEKLGSDPTEWHHEPKAMSALRVMALHAMDISNPAKVLSLSDKWSDLLRQEFFLQGDEEKHLGLPISPLCDRETVRFASSQVGFFTIIVQPTFTLMAELQHRVKDVLLTHLQTNTEAWEARKKKESGDVSGPPSAQNSPPAVHESERSGSLSRCHRLEQGKTSINVASPELRPTATPYILPGVSSSRCK